MRSARELWAIIQRPESLLLPRHEFEALMDEWSAAIGGQLIHAILIRRAEPLTCGEVDDILIGPAYEETT